MTHDFGTMSARERQEAHYEEVAQLRMELAAMERRAEKAEQTAEGVINTLRPILPSGFRGDNPIWACGKLVDHVEELRAITERLEQERAVSAIVIEKQGAQLGALEAERNAWQTKCNEVSAELAGWLFALNEWADTNSREELTGADRKLFALAREGR